MGGGGGGGGTCPSLPSPDKTDTIMRIPLLLNDCFYHSDLDL